MSLYILSDFNAYLEEFSENKLFSWKQRSHLINTPFQKIVPEAEVGSLTLKEREYVLENKPGSRNKHFLFQSIHFEKQCVNHMENSALIILTAVEPWNKWSWNGLISKNIAFSSKSECYFSTDFFRFAFVIRCFIKY